MYIEVARNKGDVKEEGEGWREIRRRVKLSGGRDQVNTRVEIKEEKDASGGGASQLERRSS